MSECFNFAPGTSFSSSTTACDMVKRLREDTDRKRSSKVMTYIRFIRQQSNWFVPQKEFITSPLKRLPHILSLEFKVFRLCSPQSVPPA
ncbi:hypothetical protein PoB_007159100 [Plakobranchus ocellatus]|uniref:DH domain-containing protein n=1 Tax=Plakobranchus ocellatus TaxID=259542 RepID=A0AAV4DMA8_9GAST|nr:hypothetical protein PoB_007159100 [Plakobranchus ocellatus]